LPDTAVFAAVFAAVFGRHFNFLLVVPAMKGKRRGTLANAPPGTQGPALKGLRAMTCAIVANVQRPNLRPAAVRRSTAAQDASKLRECRIEQARAEG
jgi:hypothetical protein